MEERKTQKTYQIVEKDFQRKTYMNYLTVF